MGPLPSPPPPTLPFFSPLPFLPQPAAQNTSKPQTSIPTANAHSSSPPAAPAAPPRFTPLPPKPKPKPIRLHCPVATGEMGGDDVVVALALPLPVAGVGLVGADDGSTVVGGGEAGISEGVLELGLEDGGAD